MQIRGLFFLLISLIFFPLTAQETFHKNGVADKRPGLYALTNAVIYQDYQTVIEAGTIIIKEDRVVAVGKQVAIPKGAIEIDLKGKYVYPAFVDPYSNYGVSNFEKTISTSKNPQFESERKQAYGWNDNVKSDYDAVEEFVLNPAEAAKLKTLGFGAVNSFRKAGIVRGTSVFATLAERPINEVVLEGKAAAHYSFSKGNTKQLYPKSIMGSVALIRQTFLDANWYSSNPKVQHNITLEAFNENLKLPQVFEASSDKLRLLLADKVGDEFGVQFIIKGNGDEYQRINEIKATKASLIIPLNFPKAYDVTDPIAANDVSLAQMKHWELAPYNAKALADNGVPFAFTTYGLKNKTELWSILRNLKTTGLSEAQILKSFTEVPASYFGQENSLGALKEGMLASFFISSKNVFDKESKILETWVQGRRDQFIDLDQKDYSGKYSLEVNKQSLNLELIKIETGHSAVIFNQDSTIVPVKLSIKENNALLSFRKDSVSYRLSGWIGNERFGGIGTDDSGQEFEWNATKKEEEKDSPEEETPTAANKSVEAGSLIYPFVAYGWEEKPEQKTLLFKNATVWTMVEDEPMDKADVLVQNGKIIKVGKNLESSDAQVIDATDKHLTPGIIDEHSHLALSSVNEGSESIVAEVRMYDAVDSEDINIYRNLSGGVTTAQLLHGSANPVGGQSAIVKFRWGATPEEMRIKDADPFIKFALGENVKQSNWGDHQKIRFPQTRMGVEQVYIDGFTQAKEYGEAKAKYASLSKKEKAKTPEPRTDLRLQTLLEIINQERFITCHSYIQSEINMLMKVAEQFDFRINTFTHILEGYKIAEKMKAHGAGASTFSDWWAYKFEVKEAIPYNATLMTNAGLTVAINSDNAEMARRLNQEAAKSVKYGDMSEIEALKMVTINPAKLLHLDDLIGSIEAGKDADLVLWSDHPLSIYARAEYTLVDGIVYYSLEDDINKRAYIQSERTRLINKMLEAKKNGTPTQPASQKEKELFHCDSEEDGITQNFNSYE